MGEETEINIELAPMSNGNEGAARANGQVEPATDEVEGFPRRKDEPETERLLENDGGSNGNAAVEDGLNFNNDVEAPSMLHNHQKKSAVCQVKEELTQKVCAGRVPLWAVLILIFVLIICIIFAALALCTVIYEDEDEKFDPRALSVQRNFNGSFQLPNVNFTEEPLNLTSLSAELKNKLAGVFKDSPALGRYFSSSEIYNFSDDVPVTALFGLSFRMPSADIYELSKFTLSKTMVYNVLRQFFFDQEDEDLTRREYITPSSLNLYD